MSNKKKNQKNQGYKAAPGGHQHPALHWHSHCHGGSTDLVSQRTKHPVQGIYLSLCHIIRNHDQLLPLSGQIFQR